MMQCKRLLLSLWVLCLCCYISVAQNKFHEQIPDLPSRPALVNDLGNMLTDNEEKQLEQKLYDYETESSNEIALVTVDTLGGLEIAEFAVELGRKWDIGKAKKRNGVLLLASKNDRKVFIAPAVGLSGVLPDVICSRIIREDIVPHFKTGNFYEGFKQGIDKIILYSKGEFIADEKTQPGFSILHLMIILLFIILLFYLMARRRSGGTYVSRRGYRNDDNDWGGGMWGGGLGGFGGGMFGGGSSGGGGGFGGFGGGGGGFDGGGAGGSW